MEKLFGSHFYFHEMSLRPEKQKETYGPTCFPPFNIKIFFVQVFFLNNCFRVKCIKFNLGQEGVNDIYPVKKGTE